MAATRTTNNPPVRDPGPAGCLMAVVGTALPETAQELGPWLSSLLVRGAEPVEVSHGGN